MSNKKKAKPLWQSSDKKFRFSQTKCFGNNFRKVRSKEVLIGKIITGTDTAPSIEPSSLDRSQESAAGDAIFNRVACPMKINVREKRRCNQLCTVQRHRQHWKQDTEQKTQTQKTDRKSNTHLAKKQLGIIHVLVECRQYQLLI